MKKCFVCQKEIEDKEQVCDSCLNFFKWKYKKDYLDKLKRFEKALKKTSLESTKSRRYKNGIL